MNQSLYHRVKAAGIAVRHACEVGVYLPHTSNILGFITDGVQSTLVEADPVTVAELHRYFANAPHVKVIDKAVYHRACTLEFCKAEASTFVKEISASPALMNDRFNIHEAQTFSVEANTLIPWTTALSMFSASIPRVVNGMYCSSYGAGRP